jgi:hypothetical protein
MVKKSQMPLLVVNALLLAVFLFVFLSRQNYEFLFYVGVIVFFLLLVVFTNRRVSYPNDVLWGLTGWSLLHMSGGGLFVGGARLYELILIPLSETYNIFRYDQFVHIVGFGVATLLMYHLIKPLLRPDVSTWVSLSIVVVMAGLGVGALNEIVEFLATVVVPETGVGGYINTSMDLVADLVGAIIAMMVIIVREKRKGV